MLLDAIGGQTIKVLPELERILGDPFLVTDETWGTGSTAEAGQAAMMELFPPAIPLE